MKKIILAIVFLITTFQLCAQEQKIVGGEMIDISDAPYQVSIKLFDGTVHQCGGIIINECWILTAAHCLSGGTGEGLMVHAGTTKQKNLSVGQLIAVDSVIKHKDYIRVNGKTPKNDLALLHLSTPLKFNDSVKSIEYATPDNTNPEDIAPGIMAFISGWGMLNGSNSNPNILRGVSIPIISNEDAGNLLMSNNNDVDCRPSNANVVDDTMISFFKEGIGSSKGDSGGPAVIGSGKDAVLIGVASWGGCPRGEFPSIYVNVRNFSHWIDEIITAGFCSCDDLIDFHFEDENGNKQREFWSDEDIFIDGIAMSDNNANYYMELFTVDNNGYTFISAATSDIIPSPPDFVNITDLFENHSHIPVDFQVGVTYSLKLGAYHPDCGWVNQWLHDKIFTIKDCCGLNSVPTNLNRDGSTLSWDPVQGAVSYIVESVPPSLFSNNCNCKYPISIKQIETKDTSTTLPSIPIGNCTLIQVRAVCSDGTISEPSDSICVVGRNFKAMKKAFVTPNPAKGDITFNVLTNDTIKVNIEVHNMLGKLVKSFILNTSPEKNNSISWNESNLKSGTYYVTFKAGNQTLYKKIIVE